MKQELETDVENCIRNIDYSENQIHCYIFDENGGRCEGASKRK